MINARTEIEITMRIKLPMAATEAEVDEWLRYKLNDNGSMQMANPLYSKAVEPVFPMGFDWTTR